tara:strand:- start:1548 stop:1889 length:342 start_codon:yes stop_codon:yes gene_type:complete
VAHERKLLVPQLQWWRPVGLEDCQLPQATTRPAAPQRKRPRQRPLTHTCVPLQPKVREAVQGARLSCCLRTHSALHSAMIKHKKQAIKVCFSICFRDLDVRVARVFQLSKERA